MSNFDTIINHEKSILALRTDPQLMQLKNKPSYSFRLDSILRNGNINEIMETTAKRIRSCEFMFQDGCTTDLIDNNALSLRLSIILLLF